ncbi:MAG: C4-type zinc ribbon domain-containing protein [Planctomycetota bacterium]
MNNQIIEKLKELQEIDLKINQLNKLCVEKSATIDKKRDEIMILQQIVNGKKDKAKQLKIEIDKKDLDLKSNEEKTNKLTIQLNTIRTNKEYSIITNAINSIKADNDVIEDVLLNFFNQNDMIQKEMRDLETKIKEKNDEINSLSVVINDEIDQIKKEIDNTCQIRTKNIEQIDSEALNKYEKIMHSKPDLTALAKVVDFTCGSCYMDVPRQQVNEILRGKQMVCCKSCSRILYINLTDGPQENNV